MTHIWLFVFDWDFIKYCDIPILQICPCPYFEGAKHICPLFSGFGFCRILIFSELGWHFDLWLDMVSAFDIPMVQAQLFVCLSV